MNKPRDGLSEIEPTSSQDCSLVNQAGKYEWIRPGISNILVKIFKYIISVLCEWNLGEYGRLVMKWEQFEVNAVKMQLERVS